MPIFDSDDPDGTFRRVLKLGAIGLFLCGILIALLAWASGLKGKPGTGKKPGKPVPAGR
ncbi:MAG: hypothetical protein HUU15_17195 [Candidatus Brocadiae bacterium]|nr:hypothetical protein [Candidatus Brocadiia bacterium]